MRNLLFSIFLSGFFLTCQSQQNPNTSIIKNIKKSDTYKASIKKIPQRPLTKIALPQPTTFAQKSTRVITADQWKLKLTNGNIPSTPSLLIDTISNYCAQYTLAPSGNEKNNMKTYLYSQLVGWMKNPPPFSWTSSAIEQPKALGTIFLMLDEDFNKDRKSGSVSELNAAASRYIRYSWNNGAGNSSFLNQGTDLLSETQRIGNVGYRIFGLASVALIINDKGAMDTLANIVKNQFEYAVNKNNYYPVALKSDGVIDQHNLGGSQIYNIGYGGDWINDMIRYGQWFKGSSWQLSDKEYYRLADILINGFQWMFYKNRAPYNIMGRHNSLIIRGNYTPPYMDQRGNIGSITSFITDRSKSSYTALLDYKQRLNNLNGFNLDSCKYFWNSDLLIQSNKNYYVSVKMLSNKTSGVETGDSKNGEGINNFHMGDGSTIIFRTGKEYDRARVVWNWRQIPGTTIKQKSGTLPLIAYGQFSNSNNALAGGISDGKIGIGTFYLDKATKYSQIKGNKSYFAFDDILVCLGNNIQDMENGNNSDIYTTINQCERVGEIVYTVDGNRTVIAAGKDVDINLNINKPAWFWQDNVGYIVIPQEQTRVRISGKNKSGNWKFIDKTNPDADERVSIFSLIIDHGNKNHWLSHGYQYIVVPNVSQEQLATFFNKNLKNKDELRITNKTNQQAVSYKNYYCVFLTKENQEIKDTWQGKTINLKADRKTAVILKKNNNTIETYANRLDDNNSSRGILSIKLLPVATSRSAQALDVKLSLNDSHSKDRLPIYQKYKFGM